MTVFEGKRSLSVTPNDSADLGFIGHLWINDSGEVDIKVQLELDDSADGAVYTVNGPCPFPMLVKKVFSTGTTATNIRVIQR